MRKLTEEGQIFQGETEAERTHLANVREAVARRGGVSGSAGNARGSDAGSGEDKNLFAALCNSGVLDEYASRMDSSTAASLDDADHLQHDIDSLWEAALLSMRSDPLDSSHPLGRDGLYCSCNCVLVRTFHLPSSFFLSSVRRRSLVITPSLAGSYVILKGQNPFHCQLVSEETKLCGALFYRTSHRSFRSFSTVFSPPLPRFL
jgi:hypothetical protein